MSGNEGRGKGVQVVSEVFLRVPIDSDICLETRKLHFVSVFSFNFLVHEGLDP